MMNASFFQFRKLIPALLFAVAVGLAGCTFLHSWQFNQHFQSDAGDLSLSREGEHEPIALFLDHDFPTGNAQPVDSTGTLLNHTDLYIEMTTETGKPVFEPVWDTLSNRKYAHYQTHPVPDDKILPGWNETGKIRHSLMLYPRLRGKSGWHTVSVKIEVYPYRYESVPIPGNRQKVKKIRSEQAILAWDFEIEMMI